MCLGQRGLPGRRLSRLKPEKSWSNYNELVTLHILPIHSLREEAPSCFQLPTTRKAMNILRHVPFGLVGAHRWDVHQDLGWLAHRVRIHLTWHSTAVVYLPPAVRGDSCFPHPHLRLHLFTSPTVVPRCCFKDTFKVSSFVNCLSMFFTLFPYPYSYLFVTDVQEIFVPSRYQPLVEFQYWKYLLCLPSIY